MGANIDTSLETARADHLSLPQHPGTPSTTTTKRVREEIITTSENSVHGKSPESPVTIRTQTVGGSGCVVCWILIGEKEIKMMRRLPCVGDVEKYDSSL